MLNVMFFLKCYDGGNNITVSPQEWEELKDVFLEYSKKPQDFVCLGNASFRCSELIFAKIVHSDTDTCKVIFKNNFARKFTMKEFEALQAQIKAQKLKVTKKTNDFFVSDTFVIAATELIAAYPFS